MVQEVTNNTDLLATAIHASQMLRSTLLMYGA